MGAGGRLSSSFPGLAFQAFHKGLKPTAERLRENFKPEAQCMIINFPQGEDVDSKL